MPHEYEINLYSEDDGEWNVYYMQVLIMKFYETELSYYPINFFNGDPYFYEPETFCSN
jgi:hypothetical protein